MSAMMTANPTLRRSDDWVERVRSASDLVEVVSQTVSLKRSGRNWVGLCPFHQEKTPSFSVHAERQLYHCFSCKAGGDVFKFVQETEKIGFVEAAELLSRRAGIPIPERRAGERSSRAPLLEPLEAAAAAYEQWLGDPEQGRKGRAYLESRGLDPKTIREFRLGFAPPGWEHLATRLRKQFGEEPLVLAGLVARREAGRGLYDRFRNRLMVPLVAPGGQVLGFGARALEPGDEPKYLNSPETPVYQKGAFLFGYEQARRAIEPEGEMVVVEGYFDAIALHQVGVGNVVATSGTALTADQARLLKRAVSRVALTYDGDAAGQDAMLRSLSILLSSELDVSVVALPPGHDPDTLVREGGIEAWRAARREASDPILFVQRHVLRARPGGDPREQALQVVVQLAARVGDTIRRRMLLERASQVFGIDEAVLARATDLRRAGEQSGRPVAAAVRAQLDTETRLERELLQSLLRSPESREEAFRQLSPEDFADPGCAALASWLWAKGDDLPEDEAAQMVFRELEMTAREGWDWGGVAQGATRRMVRKRLERRYKVAQQRILELQRLGLLGDPEALRLLEEAQELARGISELNR